MKHKFLLAAALFAALPTLPAVAQPLPQFRPPTSAPAPAPAQPILAQPASTTGAPLGSSWADITALPDFFTGSWQSRTPFLDFASDYEFTPEAQAHIDQFTPIEDIPFAGAGCRTPGMPIVQRLGSPLKFFYEPGMIAIYIENSSMTRFIRLNAEHAEFQNPTYLGTSVGHFEGDTLVVDSRGFGDTLTQYDGLPGQALAGFVLPPEVIFGPHGPDMRMVERIRLVDAETLEIQLTIYDDTIWTEPYVSNPVQLFMRNRGEAGWPNEWVCSSLPDPLGYDPASNGSIMEDPATVLERIIASENN